MERETGRMRELETDSQTQTKRDRYVLKFREMDTNG
jgi:hypothetical protein